MQEIELEKVRSELSSAEKRWREANEKELPEEEYRVLTEAKRKELSDLMKKFAEENESKNGDTTTGSDGMTKLERPSERRKRLEQQGQPNRPKSNSFDKSKGGGFSGYNQHYRGKGYGESSDNYSRGSSNRNRNYRGNDDDDAYASFGRNKNYSGKRRENERRQF